MLSSPAAAIVISPAWNSVLLCSVTQRSPDAGAAHRRCILIHGAAALLQTRQRSSSDCVCDKKKSSEVDSLVLA